LFLGAPGFDPNSAADDFTPPFPAYTSGHATMGGAIFKTLELFYGTNDFSVADAAFGDDFITSDYDLHSNEPGIDGTRTFVRFTQVGPLAPGFEDSPEGENGMSRVYLGVHWIFDQKDGIELGNAIAEYSAAHFFLVIPEPATGVLFLVGLSALLRRQNRLRPVA
jgi:hypothetical protein